MMQRIGFLAAALVLAIATWSAKESRGVTPAETDAAETAESLVATEVEAWARARVLMPLRRVSE